MARKAQEAKSTDQLQEKEPETADEFIERGWIHYSKKEFFRAEADFQKALEQKPDDADTWYALAMTQQGSGRMQEAIRSFEKTIQVLETPANENDVRARMLIRMSHAHINRIKTGDWGMIA